MVADASFLEIQPPQQAEGWLSDVIILAMNTVLGYAVEGWEWCLADVIMLSTLRVGGCLGQHG